MKKILQYFTPPVETSLFEKQKTNALIILGLFSVLLGLVMIIASIATSSDNLSLSVIIPFSMIVFITFNLFFLKKTNINISGNIVSIGIVLIMAISINIFNDDITIFYKLIGGFYILLSIYSVSVLFASEKGLFINAVIILLAITRVFMRAFEQNPEQTGLIMEGFVNYIAALVINTLVIYFAIKFARKAINGAEKDAEIIKKHKENLEALVVERTKDLETTNEELIASNEELYAKTEIIEDQNTELNATLNHLKEIQSSLLQADKMASLGILTAGVAHEINNPLNYIMGSYVGLENYFKKNENTDKNVKVLLSSLKTGVNKASDIVKGLNQFSRINDNYDENCDIHYVINNCLLILNNQLKKKIEINKNFSDEIIMISGNTGKLHQVFINIFTNSIQAIDNEGTISIISKKKEKTISIEITDTGSGISKGNLPRISDPFFTTKDPGKGTGLGLSITYSIIKKHKGSIEFISEENKGTTVKITFPIEKKQV